jgi:hypothetical protein
MSTLLQDIQDLKDEIKLLKQRERTLLAGETQNQAAIDERITACTKLLTTLISKQGNDVCPS